MGSSAAIPSAWQVLNDIVDEEAEEPMEGIQMHDGSAGGENRPRAASIMKEIAQRVSGSPRVSHVQLSTFRRSPQNWAFCEQALEVQLKPSGKNVYVVRPGYEPEFRVQVEIYVTGEPGGKVERPFHLHLKVCVFGTLISDILI